MESDDMHASPASPAAFICDQTDDADVLMVVGEVDIANAPEFRDALERCVRADRPSTVDLTGCTYIDSSGFHMLAEFGKSKPDLTIVAPEKGHVARVIELLGLSRHMNVSHRS